jgi:hypothetical protein
MKEALRYLQNARGILKKAPREGRVYTDVKPVREACGTAYRAVLDAIKDYLLRKGLTRKELPKPARRYALAGGSVEVYQQIAPNYLPKNLRREFNALYDELYIAGYYHGLFYDVKILGHLFQAAQRFILKLGQ